LSAHRFIQTDRLLVRTWREEDLDAFYQIMSDPRVFALIPEEPWTMDQTRDMIAWCRAHRLGCEPGYYNCPLILRENDTLIGRVGLNPFLKEERIPEIEWTIGADHWGQGYATEIGRAMLWYGFVEAGFNEIRGFTSPGHLASRRVMSKLGMTYLGDEVYRGAACSFYGIRREEWAAR